MKQILHSHPSISNDDIKSVVKLLRSSDLCSGKKVEEFENLAAKYIGRKYAIAVNSGFAAIHLSLLALEIKEGDEVILPAYACKALLNPVRLLGAIPVVVDIAPNSFNISLHEVKNNISKNTKAMIIPYIFGFPFDIEPFVATGIPVIEDCAHAIGGEFSGCKLGSKGRVAIFSFFATKMMTTGEGGMIMTDDPEIATRIDDYKYYGHRKNHHFIEYNYRMSDLTAALGTSQVGELDNFIRKRRILASRYYTRLQDIAGIHTEFAFRHDSIYYRFPIQLENRDMIKQKLASVGIQTGFGVLESNANFVGNATKHYPNTDKLIEQILSLPIYPDLLLEDVDYIVDNLEKIMSSES